MDRLTLHKRVTVAATPERVFAALTSPEEIVAYFPFRHVELAAHVGGAITFHGELNGTPFTDYGEIIAWQPGAEFAYTYWSDNHGTPRIPEHYLTIRYRLTAVGDGGTELRVEHERVPAGPYANAMNAAWDGLLAQLVQHLTPAH